MRSEDFIFIDGQAVRLTSVARDGETLSLVVIVRGSGGRDEMQAILGRDTFEVVLGDDPPRPMRVTDVDLRSTGTGPTAVHRFAITLDPAPGPDAMPAGETAADDLDQRLARIERKLDAIIARLDADGRLPF
ncbi:MAG: hypothetical protein ACTHQE_07160 [Thermomicrobiales bacterium]